jgi:hypothetical protein
MTEPSRFRISWDKGAYYVSIPNYQGGEVVPASIADDLVKALEEALAVIQDCVGYSHSGDPWEENAFDMGELDIHDYARDGRLEAARGLLGRVKGAP